LKFQKKKIFGILLLLLILVCATMNRTIHKIYENIDLTNLEKVTEFDLKKLPKPVQKYLRTTGNVAKEKIKTVRLKQQGLFRIKKNQDWKTLKAEQYFKEFTALDFVEYTHLNLALISLVCIIPVFSVNVQVVP